jgi:hypothetical protein
MEQVSPPRQGESTRGGHIMYETSMFKGRILSSCLSEVIQVESSQENWEEVGLDLKLTVVQFLLGLFERCLSP